MTTPRFMGREPVLWLAALNAVIALAVGFGLDLSGERQALIHGAASAVIALLARATVTPSSEVIDLPYEDMDTTPDGGVTVVQALVVIALLLAILWLVGIQVRVN